MRTVAIDMGRPPEPPANSITAGKVLGVVILLAAAAGGFFAVQWGVSTLGAKGQETGEAAVVEIDRAKAAATEKACWANEQAAENEVIAFQMNNDARQQMTLDGLVSQGALKSKPVCPGGGKYVWDPTSNWLQCSIHDRRPGDD